MNENSITIREEKPKESFFKNNYTNVAKGLAILLMLFHHLGLNPELNLFEKSSIFFKMASQCKVCVAIFLILSGYGLNISFNKKYDKKTSKLIVFTIKHLLKLMLGFWVIFILFVGFGCLTGLRTLDVYGSDPVRKLIIDFLGLASLFKTQTYNATWWFMSLIIIIYMLFPILKLILNKSTIVLGILAIFVKRVAIFDFYPNLNIYLLAFCMGMIFSELHLFDKIRNVNKSRVEEIITTLIFLGFGIYFRHKINGMYDVIAAFGYIFLCNNILIKIKGINKGLEVLGKNSANMFMLHTFLYKYFFNSWFAKLGNWVLMYIALIISTLLISMLIEKGKEIIKNTYKKLSNRVKKQINNDKINQLCD